MLNSLVLNVAESVVMTKLLMEKVLSPQTLGIVPLGAVSLIVSVKGFTVYST